MKLKLIIILVCVLTFSGCIKSACPTVCTEELAVISIKYKDTSGEPLAIKDFKAQNARTGEVYQYVQPEPTQFKGTFIVVTDANKPGLSAQGDTINVTAVHPQTNEQKSTKLVVSGGDCTCHVEKRSGPENVVFN